MAVPAMRKLKTTVRLDAIGVNSRLPEALQGLASGTYQIGFIVCMSSAQQSRCEVRPVMLV